MQEMTDKETIEHLREYVKTNHGVFSWCTDICGYDQHIKFVQHRNEFWHGESQDDFKEFILNYADKLGKKEL